MNQLNCKWWSILVPVALTLVPFFLLLHQICINFVEVPFWDQWQFVPILMKFDDHSLVFTDLFQAHNGHRIFFPRIIMLALAKFSDWNTAYEVAFILCLAVSILLALTYLAIQAFDDLPMVSWLWVMPALAVLVFSFRQYQNWLWGWQISMFLNIAACSWSIALLANKKESLTLFLLSLCLACISTFSFANGLLLWLVSVPLLLQHRHHRTLKIVIWIAVSIAVYTTYFLGLKLPRSASGDGDMLVFLLQVARFVVIVLGSLIVEARESPAAFATIFLVLCLVYCSVGILRQKPARALMPLWTVAVYSIGSAVLIAFVRSGNGDDYALQSRYTTVMVPLWATVLIFLFYAIARRFSEDSLVKNRHSGLSILLFMVIVTAGAIASLGNLQHFHDSSHERTLGRNELFLLPNLEHEELLEKLCWSSQMVKLRGAWIKERRLSLFRAD